MSFSKIQHHGVNYLLMHKVCDHMITSMVLAMGEDPGMFRSRAVAVDWRKFLSCHEVNPLGRKFLLDACLRVSPECLGFH
jgi:hypothetical protein